MTTWLRAPRTILAAGWLVFVLYSYPGYMTGAGVDQLVDARVHGLTDWAPAMMTEFWGMVVEVWAGPAAMLMLQGTLLLAGAYHLLRRAMAPRPAAACAVGVLLAPPVLATIAVIWPESLLAALGIAAAALFCAERRWPRWLGLGLVFFGSSLGHGAAFALLPIVVALCDVSPWRRRWPRYAIALALWAVLAAGAAQVNDALIGAHTHKDDIALSMDDIAGTLANAGPLDDDAVRADLTGVALVPSSALQERARDVAGHPERYTDAASGLFTAPATPEQIAALMRARVAIVLAHPWAYLAQRWRVAQRVLGLHRPRTWLPIYTSFLGATSQWPFAAHLAQHSLVQRALVAFVTALSRTPLFHPYLYALLAIMLLPLAIAWRSRLAVTLLAAGLVGEIAMLVTTQAPELRYSLWLIVTTVIAIPLLIAARISRDAATPRT